MSRPRTAEETWLPPVQAFEVDCPKCQKTRRTVHMAWPDLCWMCGEDRITARPLPVSFVWVPIEGNAA